MAAAVALPVPAVELFQGQNPQVAALLEQSHLKTEMEQMRAEMQEIRRLLQNRDRPASPAPAAASGSDQGSGSRDFIEIRDKDNNKIPMAQLAAKIPKHFPGSTSNVLILFYANPVLTTIFFSQERVVHQCAHPLQGVVQPKPLHVRCCCA